MSSSIRFLDLTLVLLVFLILAGCGRQSAEAEPVAIEPDGGFNLTLPTKPEPQPDDPTIVLGKIPLREGEQITKGKELTLKFGQGCSIETTIVPEIANLSEGGGLCANLLNETGNRIRTGEMMVIPHVNKIVAHLEDSVLNPYFAPTELPGRYFIQLTCTYITKDPLTPHEAEVYRAPLLVE